MAEAVRLTELVRLGSGREAEIYAWEEGRALRLAHDPSRAAAVDREASALASAARAGAPVPAVFERVTVEGRPGVIVQRIDGADLLARLWRRPWSVTRTGRLLGHIHARLHEVTAPPELPRVRAQLLEVLGSELVPDDVRDRAARALRELPDGDRLLHGDFHPANVLASRDGCYVIDWTNCCSGDPAADVARTCLLVMTAELPEETPPATRRIDAAGRRLLLRGYLYGYAHERGLELARVERWLPVLAAARPAEEIERERPRVLALARGEDDPPLNLPGSRPLPAANRRWILIYALAVTALINLILNAGIAALSVGDAHIPLWPASLGDTSIVTDTLGTFFILPLTTCLLVTTGVWRARANGELPPLGFGDDRVALLRALPHSRLPRGVALGALCVALLFPPAVGCLALLGIGPLAAGPFVAYKAVLGVALGAVVTPVIALCAMADPR